MLSSRHVSPCSRFVTRAPKKRRPSWCKRYKACCLQRRTLEFWQIKAAWMCDPDLWLNPPLWEITMQQVHVTSKIPNIVILSSDPQDAPTAKKTGTVPMFSYVFSSFVMVLQIVRSHGKPQAPSSHSSLCCVCIFQARCILQGCNFFLLLSASVETQEQCLLVPCSPGGSVQRWNQELSPAVSMLWKTLQSNETQEYTCCMVFLLWSLSLAGFYHRMWPKRDLLGSHEAGVLFSQRRKRGEVEVPFVFCARKHMFCFCEKMIKQSVKNWKMWKRKEARSVRCKDVVKLVKICKKLCKEV